jgi:transketolase
MKKHALYMALAAGEHASHFGAGMSIIDILAVLYSECLYYPQYGDAMWENRDRFILSKGHGVIGLYAALVEKGIISRDEIKNFEHNGTFLLGHPVQNLQHGVEFTSGSLGMGLSIGVGVALGAKRQNKKITTYVLVGDGECDEGAVWEATMAASHFRLDNLSLIIDKNGYQLGGFTKDVMNTDNLLLKFKSFGWKTIEIDGHNHQQLLSAFSHKANENQPTVIIANTKKGNGFSFSENSNNWHHAVLTEKQYREALQELEEAYDNY